MNYLVVVLDDEIVLFCNEYNVFVYRCDVMILKLQVGIGFNYVILGLYFNMCIFSSLCNLGLCIFMLFFIF